VTLNWPTEQQGSTGENVRSVQYLLNNHGSALTVDGDFGPLTGAAVRAFQTSHGLGVTGAVDAQTWPALIVQVSAGSTGDAVQAVQSQILSRSGWLTVNGTFGSDVEAAVRSFQQFAGLSVDGIVGPVTWNALVSAILRADGGQAAAELMYQAWTRNDRAAAATEATGAAVNALFARAWQASDGWSFAQSGAAAGSFICTWQRTGEQLTLEGNDGTGAPFYYVRQVTFQAQSTY